MATLSQLKSINYSEKIVIGLVYYNNDNFSGVFFQQHYAQIKGTDSNGIQYWSWGSNLKADSQSVNGIQKIYIVKRKK